jgi:Ca-activated chloride channel homolog
MIFVEPVWLWALLALPLLAAAEMRATLADRERTARLVARPLWGRVVQRPAESWRWLRLGLLLLGVAGLVLALARPQWGIVREKVEREGVDVVLALDTSGSMATEDVPPNRFFLARAALTTLLSRLEGDRFGLLAFEGEAYPLVPLTLDADAVGLFLETAQPGLVPTPGSSLGAGLAKALDMFVDKERRNKVLVLVSDGEDLEGEVEEAVRKAKEAGVVVHTVGVGTDKGEPVPEFDREGERAGFKKDEQGGAVVSRLHAETLEAIARGTGGQFFRITPADTTLGSLAAAIEGQEQKGLAREYSYRKKERFQVPLGVGLGALAMALLVPLPRLGRRARGGRVAACLAGLLLLAPAGARAQGDKPVPGPTGSRWVPGPTGGQWVPGPTGSRWVDEILLRPRRLTAEARKEYELGNHPKALQGFESAAGLRAADPRARFNVADGLYKNGKFDEAETAYRALGGDVRSPLAPPARFNLGNALFQKQDYRGAVSAYRDALRLAPDDVDAKRNLELALRALQQQQQDQKQKQDQKQQQDKQQDQPQKSQGEKDQKKQEPDKKPGPGQPSPRPKTEQEKEQERFQKETGMPKERAMQLLDTLQQDEKAQQKKLLLAQKAKPRKGKDW